MKKLDLKHRALLLSYLISFDIFKFNVKGFLENFHHGLAYFIQSDGLKSLNLNLKPVENCDLIDGRLFFLSLLYCSTTNFAQQCNEMILDDLNLIKLLNTSVEFLNVFFKETDKRLTIALSGLTTINLFIATRNLNKENAIDIHCSKN